MIKQKIKLLPVHIFLLSAIFCGMTCAIYGMGILGFLLSTILIYDCYHNGNKGGYYHLITISIMALMQFTYIIYTNQLHFITNIEQWFAYTFLTYFITCCYSIYLMIRASKYE